MELQIHTVVTSTSFHLESQKNNFGFKVAYYNDQNNQRLVNYIIGSFITDTIHEVLLL